MKNSTNYLNFKEIMTSIATNFKGIMVSIITNDIKTLIETLKKDNNILLTNNYSNLTECFSSVDFDECDYVVYNLQNYDKTSLSVLESIKKTCIDSKVPFIVIHETLLPTVSSSSHIELKIETINEELFINEVKNRFGGIDNE